MPSIAAVDVTDYHTAGEPFRIVTAGLPEIPGRTVLERRAFAQDSPSVDVVRQLLVNEPRGHADMYGGFVVAPDDAGAHFGVLFWHKDGYSTACGHGTIALGAWAVRTGRVSSRANGDTDVIIDVPSGRVVARVTCTNGIIEAVSFRNVPAYPVARDVVVDTSRGQAVVSVGYGGALYASTSATELGLEVKPSNLTELIAIGREIKWALNDSEWARHSSDSRLDGIYGTILFEDLGDGADGPRQRNVTVFADGEVDRSPCGSGTSTRIALLADAGRLRVGQVLHHESIVGTKFSGRVLGPAVAEGRAAYLTEVTGVAFETGTARFTLDPRDELGVGFTLR